MKIKYRVRQLTVGSWVTGKVWGKNSHGLFQAYKVGKIYGNRVIIIIDGRTDHNWVYTQDELFAIGPDRTDVSYYD